MSEAYEVTIHFYTKEAAELMQNTIYKLTGRGSTVRKVNPDAHPE